MLEVNEQFDTRRFQLNDRHFAIRYCKEDKIIYANTQGFWSVEHTESYFDALNREMVHVRAQIGALKLLVDRRGNPAQSSEVIAIMKKAHHELYTSSDKLAMLVDSSLLKMQMRRVFVREAAKAFLSAEAALTWLKAK